MIKLIDFGSSCYLNKKTYSYIQSRCVSVLLSYQICHSFVHISTKILPLSGSNIWIELHSKDRHVVLRVCGGGNAHRRAALWGRQPGRSDVPDHRYSGHATTWNDSQQPGKSSLHGKPTLAYMVIFNGRKILLVYVFNTYVEILKLCVCVCSSSNESKWALRCLQTPPAIWNVWYMRKITARSMRWSEL